MALPGKAIHEIIETEMSFVRVIRGLLIPAKKHETDITFRS